MESAEVTTASKGSNNGGGGGGGNNGHNGKATPQTGPVPSLQAPPASPEARRTEC